MKLKMIHKLIQKFDPCVNKYLGTIVTKDNLIEEEIKERIASGNRAFFANKNIFQSKLIFKKFKINLYKVLIRSVVVYGSEWWVLT